MRQHLPAVEQFIERQIPGHPEYSVVRKLDSGSNGHVFVAKSEAVQREIACKVIPVENLVGVDRSPPTWKEEILKANMMPSSASRRASSIEDATYVERITAWSSPSAKGRPSRSVLTCA